MTPTPERNDRRLAILMVLSYSWYIWTMNGVVLPNHQRRISEERPIINEIATWVRASFWSCIPHTKARSPNTSCDGHRCYCDITAISTYIPDVLLVRSYRSYPRIMTMCEGSNCQLLHINGSNVIIDGLSNTVLPEQFGSYHANAIWVAFPWSQIISF